MAHIPSELENSISLDESSDYDTSGENIPQKESWQNTETSLDSDISRLKAQNIHRLQKRWDEIICKYSEIDDSKESDEIDLATGKIIVDNGHLRSFADHSASAKGVRPISSIWDVDDRFEKDVRKYKQAEKIRRTLRNEEKERLKANSMFYNKKMQELDLGSRVLPDNISLLNPSPTKKQKTNINSTVSSERSSPIKDDTHSLSYGVRLSTPISSPLKQKLPSLASSPNHDVLESPTRNSPKTRENLTYNFGDHESLKYTPDLPYSEGNSDDNKEYTNISDTDSDEYDESFSITEFYEPLPVSFFRCAFYGCRYTSTSKASYRAHLLSMHSPELQKIGYPVQTRVQHTSFIPGDTIPKLNIHFPTKIDSPPKHPYVCGYGLDSGKCKKIFIDDKHFSRHWQQRPKLCSTKRQVLACPLLGCDFMTDENYREFYNHMKSHDKNEFEPRDDKEPNFSCHDDFLNDTSSITFSDYEQENSREQDFFEQPQELHVRKSYSPKKVTESHRIAHAALEKVPKLNILDSGVDFDIQSVQKGDEQGYLSIDELFQDDA